MATPHPKEAEESIYDLLRTIRRRPGLYIADPELTRLHSFIVGYECGLARGSDLTSRAAGISRVSRLDRGTARLC
jgi:hypothetical protein